MNLITEVTNAPKQRHNIILEDGSSFTFELYFISLQFGWFITSLEYENFVVRGLRVCNSPNILNKFKNVLPFGLACTGVADREPMFIDDFLSSNNQLVVLTAEEVLSYNRFLEQNEV